MNAAAAATQSNPQQCTQSNHLGADVRDCDDDDCENTICDKCVGNRDMDVCGDCVKHLGIKI